MNDLVPVDIRSLKLHTILDRFIDYSIEFSLMLLKSSLVILIGYFLIKFARYRIYRVMLMASRDETVSCFVEQLATIGLWLLVLITVLGIFKVPTASIIAALGTAGIAIALSLKDSLSSVAGGIVLIVLGLFKKGDYIDMGSVAGNVEVINLFNTHISTLDGRLVIVPNSNITNSVIVNNGRSSLARVEIIVGVSYNADLRKTKEILNEVVLGCEGVLKDKPIFVGVTDLASSSVDFSIRFWIPRENGVYATKSMVIELIKMRLDENSIEIPYNKLDVNLIHD